MMGHLLSIRVILFVEVRELCTYIDTFIFVLYFKFLAHGYTISNNITNNLYILYLLFHRISSIQYQDQREIKRIIV